MAWPRKALPGPRTQLDEQRDAIAAGDSTTPVDIVNAAPQSCSASRCTTAEPVVPTGANGSAV